jgi:uncharacterized protein (DUF488 family)
MTANDQSMLADPIFTVGHSNRSISEFIGVVQSAAIRILVDVRRFPASRRHPHFNADALKQSLAAVGIAYRHVPELGGYRETTESRSSGANDSWPPGFLRNYADYAMTLEFQAALDYLLRTLQSQTALMCAEKLWTDCHRQIIADYMIARGHEVVHVVDARTQESGKLSPSAVCSPPGIISYPLRQSQLRLDL